MVHRCSISANAQNLGKGPGLGNLCGWRLPSGLAMGFPQACLPELGGEEPSCPLSRFQPMDCCDFFLGVGQEVVVPRV